MVSLSWLGLVHMFFKIQDQISPISLATGNDISPPSVWLRKGGPQTGHQCCRCLLEGARGKARTSIEWFWFCSRCFQLPWWGWYIKSLISQVGFHQRPSIDTSLNPVDPKPLLILLIRPMLPLAGAARGTWRRCPKTPRRKPKRRRPLNTLQSMLAPK